MGNMAPCRSVLLMYLCQLLVRKIVRGSHQCRPEPAVHECDLATDEATDQDVVGLPQALKHPKDLTTS